MKKRERKIASYLETLVGYRFNKKGLKKALQLITGCKKIKIEDISDKEDELADYNFVFEFKNKKKDLYGLGDIYFLKMRKNGQKEKFQVTEVAIEFNI